MQTLIVNSFVSEWLVHLKSQALRGFSDDQFSMLLERAMNYISEMINGPIYLEPDGNNCIDQKVGEDGGANEDLEMIDTIDGAKTVCNSNFTVIETCRKRKGEKDEEGLRVKLFKYQIHDSPIKNFSPFQNEVSLIRRS